MRKLLKKYECTEKSYLCRCLKEEIDTIETILSLRAHKTE